MLWFKSCPRCGGTLQREPDFVGGFDAVCIQCGHVAPLQSPTTLPGWTSRELRRRRAPTVEPPETPTQAA